MSETEIMDYLKLAISSLCGDRIHFSTSNKAADEHTKQARLVGQWLDGARASSPDPDWVHIENCINIRLNNQLCEMKPEYDDSITGFNEAWDIVRAVFKQHAAGKLIFPSAANATEPERPDPAREALVGALKDVMEFDRREPCLDGAILQTVQAAIALAEQGHKGATK